LSEVFDGTKELPVKPIILTFDDGYRDFYTDAYPILLKYRAKATVYVISGFIGFKNYMTKEQIREIAQNRLVEIGSHTVHHVSLKFAPIEEVQKELIESKNELSVLTGLPVISFAYPNGSYDDKAVNAVKEVGFKTAVATKPGVELDPGMRYFLVRIRTGGLSGKELLNRLNQKTISMY